MSSSSDDPMPTQPRTLRKRFVHQANYPQNIPPDDTEYQADRATRVRLSMPKDFTAHEGPPILKIEDALLLYNPAVNSYICFTEKFRKGDTTHEELTVHLAINGKRPRTADECKTAKVVKAPWGNLFHRWMIQKNGARYFVKLINGRWRPWMGKIKGLSRKAIAFPVEEMSRASLPQSLAPQAFGSSRSRGDSLQQSQSGFALSSGFSDFDSEASDEQGSPTPVRTWHLARKAYKRAKSNISEDPQSEVDEHNDRAATSQKSETDEGYDGCAETTRTLRQGTLAKFRSALALPSGESEPANEGDKNDGIWSTRASHHYYGANSVVSISSDSAGTTMDDAPEQAPLNSSLHLRPRPDHKNHTPASILEQKQIGRTIETQPTNLDEVTSTQDEAIEDRSSNKDTDEPQVLVAPISQRYTSNATPAITAIEPPKKSVQTLKDGIFSMHKIYLEEAGDRPTSRAASNGPRSIREIEIKLLRCSIDSGHMQGEVGARSIHGTGMRGEWQDALSTADKLRGRLNVVRTELKKAILCIAGQRAEQAIEKPLYTPHIRQMDHIDKAPNQDQLKRMGLEGERQTSHANKAEPAAQQGPDTNQNSRKRRLSASNTPGDTMAKDNEIPATHAMVLSSRSKHTSEIPSRAAQRRRLQSSSDTIPNHQVDPPRLSHGNDHRGLLRPNPASTPQWAAITPSEGYQLAPQPLRHEPMARPSLAPTMPLRIYLVQISELPNADILAPHWSKPQVVRSNENPYGLWVGCMIAILRHPNTLKIRQLIRDGTLPIPTPHQTLELQQLLNGHEASFSGFPPHTQLV
ncbi:MAG: hypothetical protein Q9192_001679 [Flavoplaca navasiana]